MRICLRRCRFATSTTRSTDASRSVPPKRVSACRICCVESSAARCPPSVEEWLALHPASPDCDHVGGRRRGTRRNSRTLARCWWSTRRSLRRRRRRRRGRSDPEPPDLRDRPRGAPRHRRGGPGDDPTRSHARAARPDRQPRHSTTSTRGPASGSGTGRSSRARGSSATRYAPGTRCTCGLAEALDAPLLTLDARLAGVQGLRCAVEIPLSG